jgi:hypothetical protein
LGAPPLRQALLTFSILLCGFGAYGYFLHPRSANLATELFALFGFALTVLVACYPALFASSESRDYNESAKSSPPPIARETIAPTATGSALYSIPATRGFALLGHAALLFIGTFYYLSSGIYYVTSVQAAQSITDKWALFLIPANILLVIGLPGFHAAQSAKSGHISLVGCILWGTSALVGSLALWSAASGTAYQQNGQLRHAVWQLTAAGDWIEIAASVLLFFAIRRAKVFPSWTAYVMLLGIIVNLIWIEVGDTTASADLVQRLGAFAGAIAGGVFGWYLLKPHFRPGFGVFRQ